MRYTNLTNIPLSVAVWLIADDYDGQARKDKMISVTTLLKSPRQIILGKRAEATQSTKVIDVADLMNSALGKAFHNAVESVWNNRPQLEKALADLGYPPKTIKKIVVNPTEKTEGQIPVYMEQRVEREFCGWTITGKYDMICDGAIEDHKSTSTFIYINDSKSDDYALQGSMYRWLNPDIVNKPYMQINFLFKDWTKAESGKSNYPPSRLHHKKYDLLPIAATETFIRNKLQVLDECMQLPEPELPYCTKEELWQREPTYKYYKSGVISSRSTKNFDTAQEAYARLEEDGGTGLVVEVPAKPTACLYCNVSHMCSQFSEMKAAGVI